MGSPVPKDVLFSALCLCSFSGPEFLSSENRLSALLLVCSPSVKGNAFFTWGGRLFLSWGRGGGGESVGFSRGSTPPPGARQGRAPLVIPLISHRRTIRLESEHQGGRKNLPRVLKITEIFAEKMYRFSGAHP